MARYGILSDIHGNTDALTAALGFLRERDVDGVLCLGDIVGYNPEGDACVDVVRDLGIASIAGNHDRIATGRLGTERCADKAAFALNRTKRDLAPASRAFLDALPSRRVVEDEVLLVHGGVDDVTEYVTSPRRVEANAARMARQHPGARVCFFGHTHEQKVYALAHGVADARAPAPSVRLDEPGRVYFVNPGSVDAARKAGDKRAEFAVFDTATRDLELHSVPYDDARIERLAAERGYRMDRLDAWLYRTARRLRRARDRALARLGVQPGPRR